MLWFLENSPSLCSNVAALDHEGFEGRMLLAVVNHDRLERILARALDEEHFLSPFGIRSVAKYHREHPFALEIAGRTYRVDYEPAESTTGTFGGNSNWRGPVWFPMNFLLVEALQKFHYQAGDDFKVECPTGSGRMLTLWEVSMELSHRLVDIFTAGADGRRAVYGTSESFKPTRTGATTFCFSNTSMATPEPVWAPATKPAGRDWSPSLSSSTESIANVRFTRSKRDARRSPMPSGAHNAA